MNFHLNSQFFGKIEANTNWTCLKDANNQKKRFGDSKQVLELASHIQDAFSYT